MIEKHFFQLQELLLMKTLIELQKHQHVSNDTLNYRFYYRFMPYKYRIIYHILKVIYMLIFTYLLVLCHRDLYPHVQNQK